MKKIISQPMKMNSESRSEKKNNNIKKEIQSGKWSPFRTSPSHLDIPARVSLLKISGQIKSTTGLKYDKKNGA